MSRIRSLKPSWLEDSKIAACHDAGRLMSVALILLADDHGRGRASLPWLAGQVWPYEEKTRERISKTKKALDALSRVGFLIVYEVRGEQYYLINNWCRHQRVDNAGFPRHPAPEDATDHSLDLTCGEPPRLAADCGSEEEEEEEEENSRARASRAPAHDPPAQGLTPFSEYVRTHWPDVPRPWEWEPVLRDAFPHLDLLAEAKGAVAWEASNPEKAKKRHARFFSNWLRRSQDDGRGANTGQRRGSGGYPQATPRPNVASPERTQAELDALARESIELAERARSQA